MKKLSINTISIIGTIASIIGIIISIISGYNNQRKLFFWLFAIFLAFIIWSLIKLFYRKKPKGSIERDLNILPIYTKESKENRRLHHNIFKNYLLSHKINNIDFKWIDDFIVTDPSIDLEGTSSYIDCICSVICSEGKIGLIFPTTTPIIEGIGRTSILLNLLGCSIHYSDLIDLEISHIIEDIPEIKLMRDAPKDYCLVSADMAYVGSENGRMFVIPIKGELFSFLWDLARHIYRKSQFNYQPGEHRTEQGREKILAILNKLDISMLNNYYAELHKIYEVDEIFILRRYIKASSQTNVQELLHETSLSALKEAMLFNLKHKSKFWDRHIKSSTERVERILDSIDKDCLPSIKEISITYQEEFLPDYVVNEVADIIRSGQNISIEEIPSPKIGIGTRYHNELLIKNMYSLNDGDKIIILATSGEKSIRDDSFWKVLYNLNRNVTIIFLLLDPNSEIVKDLWTSKYKGTYEQDFLINEINENINTIKRISKIFIKSNKMVTIKCKEYSMKVPFRITLVGSGKIIVSAYAEGIRTGSKTVFYEYNRHYHNDIFLGFFSLLQDIDKISHDIV